MLVTQGFSDNVKAFEDYPTDSKISSSFCSCLDITFLTELQVIFLLIPIATPLLVHFAPDTMIRCQILKLY